MIYKVRHTAKLDYIAYVEADSEEDAKGSHSYGLAVEMQPVEHYWHDSGIMDWWTDDDEDAPEIDFSLKEAT